MPTLRRFLLCGYFSLHRYFGTFCGGHVARDFLKPVPSLVFMHVHRVPGCGLRGGGAFLKFGRRAGRCIRVKPCTRPATKGKLAVAECKLHLTIVFVHRNKFWQLFARVSVRNQAFDQTCFGLGACARAMLFMSEMASHGTLGLPRLSFPPNRHEGLQRPETGRPRNGLLGKPRLRPVSGFPANQGQAT